MARLARYPFWKPGNPQNRVFFTDFYMALMRPTKPMPENVVQFKCPAEMSKFDIKNYLQNIYKVPVIKVSTHIRFAKVWRDHLNRRIKPEPDYKVAYVTLGQGMTFKFPELYPDKFDEEKDVLDDLKEQEKTKTSNLTNRGGVPDWFGI
ncbi:large ribosomal subunit protein uL23m-like [Saccoglossus kowalevskii]|uniref:Large ribosomal subunit protein uL23m n=1 Tax=Saccoglossus kowalevskii TaxID=10224 RepID=A0ABM0GN78_SACKO|nr:PREDICTED: 39S ribosomal protein L23, mitochondrial-like [Saccoglossus kowalevskii]